MQKKYYEISISQSLIKDIFRYKEGQTCGIQFEEKFINGTLFPSSAVQLLGQYFEYRATGQLPKNKMIPLPDRTTKNELTAPYKKMEAQLLNWNKIKEKYQIKILSTGRKISVFDKTLCENPIDGTTDLELSFTDFQTGEKFEYAIGDIKTTGLLDNKWSDFGWEINNLNNKVNIILQPIHYKFIRMLETGKDEEPPFVFFLFSNTNETDCRIIKFNIDIQQHIQNHRVLIQNTVKELEYQMRKGFKAYPSVAECADCPLKATCKHFIDVPLIQNFNYEG